MRVLAMASRQGGPMIFNATSKKPSVVTPAREFREVIERERARAERYGRPLSILQFRKSQNPATGGLERVVGAALSRRLRETDHVGWTQEGWIAVVLPDTDRAGATKVASEVAERVRRTDPSISIAIDCFGN
jgi:hypothetical protein